jgi:hypothetical protein
MVDINDPGLQAIMTDVARKAAMEVVSAHESTFKLLAQAIAEKEVQGHRQYCGIEDIKVEWWGKDDRPGLKQDLIALKGTRGYLRDLTKPILAALIAGAVVWMMGHYQKADNITTNNNVTTPAQRPATP